VVTTEYIEWQVTVAVITAVEEFPLLVTVQRIVRGIEVKKDLLRRLGVSIQEHLDQQCFDSRLIDANLMIAIRLWLA
jgi:hypothetical protein